MFPCASYHSLYGCSHVAMRARRILSNRLARPSVRFRTHGRVRPIFPGDQVALDLEGKLSGGTTIKEASPLVFIVGSGHVLPGVEKAVQGMRKGESKTLVLPPAEAFGLEPHVLSVSLNDLPLDARDRKRLGIGQIVEFTGGERAHVVNVTEDRIDLDLAHPYAGQSLTVTIKIVEHKQVQDTERRVVPQVIANGDETTFPQPGDTLVIHYTGKLAHDGHVFDSSYDRGQPFQFEIGSGQVIRGWEEGVMRMSKGMKATLYIPAAKAYGSAGAGGVIPPNADLIFDVELLDLRRRESDF